MTVVIARDATATDHLVYAWPFPLGPEEIEISCGDDEVVVMCPSWLVGDRLGPGRHRWRTPDPTRPVGAYFVSTQPVECSFDVSTSFVIPSTQQPATLRAQGAVVVRCVDPGLLIAQFVGLPFDNVNEGLIKSVARSAERLIARVLTRRTVVGQTTMAVTDPAMLPSIIEELIAYNPAAGAVFGVEFMRLTGLYITTVESTWNTHPIDVSPEGQWSQPGIDVAVPQWVQPQQTAQGLAVGAPGPAGTPPGGGPRMVSSSPEISGVSGEIGGGSAMAPPPAAAGSGPGLVPPPPEPPAAASVEDEEPAVITDKDVPAQDEDPRSTLKMPPPIPRPAASAASRPAEPAPPIPPPVPPRKQATTLPAVPPPPGMTPSLAAITPRPKTTTSPGTAPAPGATGTPPPPNPASDAPVAAKPAEAPKVAPSDGVPVPVMGIGVGMGGIGIGRVGATATSEVPTSPISSGGSDKAVAGEIIEKLDKGARVLVPGADGRLVAATILAEQSGYYELEIGGSNETLWVPRANVVAEK